MDNVQDLWRELSALEDIVIELEGAGGRGRRRTTEICIDDQGDVIQSLQGKMCLSQLSLVADEVTRVLKIEEKRLEEEINRCRRVLDAGSDTVLSISSRYSRIYA